MERKASEESGGIYNRKTRQCGPKSRSGCKTCKIRHIKCDETKPTCKKCSSSGWVCDGYVESTPRQGGALSKTKPPNLAAKAPPIKNPFLDFPGTSKEHRSFHFFFNGMGRRPNIFEDDFWGHYLQNLAVSQKPIQHALVAVAALIEDLLDDQDIHNAKSRNFSLVQYNKAINNLTSYTGDRESRQITLLTCLLFLYLETLSDIRKNMWAHFKSGIDMMESYRRDFIDPRRRELGLSDIDSDIKEQDTIFYEIHRAFWKSGVGLLVCWPAPHTFVGSNRDIEPSEPPDEVFSSLSQVETRLNKLVIETLQPEKVPTAMTGHGLLTEQGIFRKLNLILKLQKWTAGLGVFIIDNFAIVQAQSERIQLLRMQSIIATIWNSVTLWNSETAFDKHLTEFRTLLSLSKQFINIKEAQRLYPTLTSEPSPATSTTSSPSSSTHSALAFRKPSSSTSSISDQTSQGQSSAEADYHRLPQDMLDDMGIICVLHFIAMKCRSPSVRREAIKLLGLVQPQFESPWHAPTSRRIGQYVVQFEEGSCSHPITEDPVTWPQESRRIHATYRVPLGLMVKTDRPINFVWRPGGEGTPWITFRANVP